MPVLRTWSKDKRVKFWLPRQSSPEPEVDRSELVGFFLPVLNNIDLIEGMYHSFVRSMPIGYPFGLIALDGGSTDGTLEFLQANMVTYSNRITSTEKIPEDITGLCKLTEEVAIRMLLGNYNKSQNVFKGEQDFGYIGYLHSDMDFMTEGWVKLLVSECKKDDNIGIIGPRTEQSETMEQRVKFGNVHPMIMPVRVLKDHYRHFGCFVDPELYFQVGYCDWDLQLRSMTKLGYKSLIYRDAFVRHPMCGTRPTLHKADPQRNKAFEYNRDYWCNKWGLDFTDDPFHLLAVGKIKIERTV